MNGIFNSIDLWKLMFLLSLKRMDDSHVDSFGELVDIMIRKLKAVHIRDANGGMHVRDCLVGMIRSQAAAIIPNLEANREMGKRICIPERILSTILNSIFIRSVIPGEWETLYFDENVDFLGRMMKHFYRRNDEEAGRIYSTVSFALVSLRGKCSPNYRNN